MAFVARAFILLAALLWTIGACAADAPAAGGAESAGERIFLHGLLPSGKELQATNATGLVLRGQAAACVNCHRRSGLGSREGRSVIPPIAGSYLFRPTSAVYGDRTLHYVEGVRDKRAPYTDALLAKAIRDGFDSEGRPLKSLMPHFTLAGADMAALIAYLRALDPPRVPGVTDKVLHFATIVAPDADPVKRGAMLDVMNQFFAERNARQMAPTPRMKSDRIVDFMVHRRWELHVWELTGPETSWGAQLEQRMKETPVFAVLSGLAGHTWEPVHRFCEKTRVPCLFPNVEAPVVADQDFYSIYFTRGVLLEADLIASRLLAHDGGEAARTVFQIYRAGDAGDAGAAALAASLRRRGIDVQSHVVAADAPADAVVAALAEAGSADAVVTWLRPPDWAALQGAPAPGIDIYASGLLAGLERAPVPPAWRARTHVAYPFDLPERRRVRTDFAYGWFRIRHIPVVADQVQVDTLLACGLVSEALNHVSDTFVRDYLIERLEDMVEHRVITGYYPRLALASGQRFASKGGYVVRLAGERGTGLIAETNWLVP